MATKVTTILVHPETRQKLGAIKQEGETFEKVILRLIEYSGQRILEEKQKENAEALNKK